MERTINSQTQMLMDHLDDQNEGMYQYLEGMFQYLEGVEKHNDERTDSLKNSLNQSQQALLENLQEFATDWNCAQG